MTKVTITLSPEQFDRLRAAVEGQQRYHLAESHNRDEDAAMRSAHRQKAVELGLLMETLNRS